MQNKVLIKNEFLAFNVHMQYASQMGFLYLRLNQTQKKHEANKASEDGIEAGMYVNSRKFWNKQTRKSHPSVSYLQHEHYISWSCNLHLVQTHFLQV